MIENTRLSDALTSHSRGEMIVSAKKNLTLSDEDYQEFIERKRKEADIMYRFFDYTELEFKRHYLKQFVQHTLRSMYGQNNKGTYNFTTEHWKIINRILETRDSNILDMLWFSAIWKFSGVRDWIIRGDEKNGGKSSVHNTKMFSFWIDKELNPSMSNFMISNPQYTVKRTVRLLRWSYFYTCGFPDNIAGWRREFNREVEKREKAMSNTLHITEKEEEREKKKKKRRRSDHHHHETESHHTARDLNLSDI